MPLERSSLEDTWQRWQAPGAPDVRQLTREEMIAELTRYHVHPPVEISDLRYWEYWGVLPRPVRRAAVEGGRAVARYPVWVVTLIMALRHLQADGVTLEEIGPLLRIEARRVSLAPPNSRMHVVGLPPVPHIHERYPLPPNLVAKLDSEQRDTVAMLSEMLLDSILLPYEHGPEPHMLRLGDDEPLPFAITDAALVLTDERGRRVTIILPVDRFEGLSESSTADDSHSAQGTGLSES